MGWRTVLISKTSKLDYKMGYLCVRSKDELIRIHIDEINSLIIESTNISLTSYLLVELGKKKVNVIFCDDKKCPSGTFLSYYGSYDTSRKIRNQIAWSKETKSVVWKNVIYHKILGQSCVLNFNGKDETAYKLSQYLPEIELGDVTNREGHAAKVYFNSLFSNDFSRDDDNNVINAALNYGYSIVLSSMAREIVSNGYITQLGIFHDNVFNQFNLASDLMEPFRPFVDQIVLNMEFDVFEHEEKMTLVQILNKKIKIDNREQYFSNALSIYAKSILEAIDKCAPDNIKFPDYDLSIYESNSVL